MEGLLPLIGAGVAVVALVALSVWLGFRGQPVLAGEYEARAFGRSIPGGFEVLKVLVAQDGRHALLVERTGRIAVIVPHGAHFIARLVDGPMTVRRNGGALEFAIGRAISRVTPGEQLPEWIELLAPPGVQA